MELNLKMLIDIHTHLVNKNFIKSKKINLAAKLMLKKCEYTNFDDYIKNFLKQLTKSKLDKTVLIGIEIARFVPIMSRFMMYVKHILNFYLG